MTIKDQNVAGKLYLYSNKLWHQEIHVMRQSVGSREDDDVLSRTFNSSFEYLFGDSDDLNDSDHEDTKPLLGKKTVQSSFFTTANRPINSTFSYEGSSPTVFKPKLNFISTKDVFKVMIDGSKDFCASKARARSRLLQRPEMWDRIVVSKEDTASGREYESYIYQLMEFRILYEYLNGGSGGQPFSNIKSQYPTDAEKWAKKEQSLVEMEEGSTTSTAPATPAVDSSKQQVNPGPKKTRKKRLMEKIAASHGTVAHAHAGQKEVEESSASSEEEDATEIPAPDLKAEPALVPFPALVDSDDGESDEWIEVGTGSKIVKKTDDSVQIDFKEKEEVSTVTLSKEVLSAKHRKHQFKVWTWSDTKCTYVSRTLQAATIRTFLEVVPIDTSVHVARAHECPF